MSASGAERESAPRLGEGLPASASVLAVCAHPDDESFGLGGILHRFTQADARVSVLCLTRGEASTLGGDLGGLGALRSAEVRAASAELGLELLELKDYPDGALAAVPFGQLTADVAAVAARVGADLLVVLDSGGVTGHPDHERATEAALAGAPHLPALAWTIPEAVAEALNEERGTVFRGRVPAEVDFAVRVDRSVQRRAIHCHASQCGTESVVWRRLELLGEMESLRWLRPPNAPASAEPCLGASSFAALSDQWDERYRAAAQVFRPQPDETLARLAASLSPGRAVDLGAGEGRNSLYLAQMGWQVVAVDASRVALERIRAHGEGAERIEAVHADLLDFLAGAGERFDLAVLAYVHPEPGERERLLGAAAASLAPGGHLFLVGHHRSGHGRAGPPDAARLYAEEEVTGALAGLEILRLGRREGTSDVVEPGVDLVVWARRRAGEP